MLNLKDRFSITLLLLVLIAANCEIGHADPYLIRVDKSDNILVVENNRGNIVKKYTVAVGRGGKGDKKLMGDKKTPVGSYLVTGFNEKSKFDFFIRLNYPNIKDAYYGYINRTISKEQFTRIVSAVRASEPPPQNTKLGGAIGIHGIGRETSRKLLIHRNIDWTEGCVALRNYEVKELKRFVSVGTKVIISE
ncbi:MAG: L,D-transpeptidase family protein [Pseudomonadota bacterium]|nr:L,D-transpeptidase family protein [Pseudomonadota bacterium]